MMRNMSDCVLKCALADGPQRREVADAYLRVSHVASALFSTFTWDAAVAWRILGDVT